MVLLWLSENFGQDALDRHHSSGLPRNRPPSARRSHRKLIVNKDEKVGDFAAAFCWEMLMGIFQQSHSLRRGMNPQLQPGFIIYYRAVWSDSYWVGGKNKQEIYKLVISPVDIVHVGDISRNMQITYGPNSQSVFRLHFWSAQTEDSVGESSDEWRRKPTI